jgi:hypothetical protein
MADFFSFEYFDELPADEIALPSESAGSRRNLSLSASSAEYLRDAVQRLVPSSYVYGESGIGERAYELYGLCVSHALTGKRCNKLLAALCIMYASYERRSDLVILPTDIETKYANLRMSQLRLTNIMCVYDDFCHLLHLPKLEVPMDKLLRRVFKQGCKVESESDVFRFTETALRFEKELKSVTDYTPLKSDQRTNYRQKFKAETIAAVCAILSLRFHQYTKATAKSVEKELTVSKGSVHYLINKFKSVSPLPATEESQASPKKRRTDPLYIGGLDVPAGVAKRRKDEGSDNQASEEVLAIFPSENLSQPTAIDPGDPLSFLYEFNDLLTTNPAPLPPPLPPPETPESESDSKRSRSRRSSSSSRTTSGWDDLL